MEPRRVVLFGSSGFLGRRLTEFLQQNQWDVTTVNRSSGDLRWDGEHPGDWVDALDGADAVVNLAGRSVNCRYSAVHKKEILDSRLKSTHAVGRGILRVARRPRVWLNASSATVYRHAEDRPMDERTGELGRDFSMNVVRQWEAQFFAEKSAGVRQVALRTAIVIDGQPGGAFSYFRRLAQWGLAGTLGPGTQMMSWIHAEDFCRAVAWLLEHDELSGPVNLSAPNPLPNRDFMRIVRQECGAPFGLPASRWMLEIGAFVLRTETELLLKSRWVVPALLQESGFEFLYPDCRSAVREIVKGEKRVAREVESGVLR